MSEAKSPESDYATTTPQSVQSPLTPASDGEMMAAAVIERLNLSLKIVPEYVKEQQDSTSSANLDKEAEEIKKRQRAKRRKRKKRGEMPDIKIFKGTFAHATWQDPMVIQQMQIIGVQNGKVKYNKLLGNV